MYKDGIIIEPPNSTRNMTGGLVIKATINCLGMFRSDFVHTFTEEGQDCTCSSVWHVQTVHAQKAQNIRHNLDKDASYGKNHSNKI
jgi:hypothetical protein